MQIIPGTLETNEPVTDEAALEWWAVQFDTSAQTERAVMEIVRRGIIPFGLYHTSGCAIHCATKIYAEKLFDVALHFGP